MKIGSKTRVTREVTRQERNRRNNMKRITISALVAFILFIALTVIQSSILNQETKVTVYQVQKDIYDGTKITEDNFNEYFATKAVQVSLIPDGYITDSSLIIGKFINRNYKARDVITVDGLNDSEALYNSNIKHPVKLSFKAGSLSDSVSGTIREGDYINIYGMRNAENTEGEIVKLTNQNYTFKHIYIEKAYNESGDIITSDDKKSEALLFTIVIEEDDVALFNEMVENCNLKLVKVMYDTDQDYKAFIGKEVTDNKSNSNNVVDEESESDEVAVEESNSKEVAVEESDDEQPEEINAIDDIKNKIKGESEADTTEVDTNGTTTSETTTSEVENETAENVVEASESTETAE